MTRMAFLGGWRDWIIYHALLTTNQYVDKWLNNYFHSFYRLAYPHCRPHAYILSYLSRYWVILYMPTMMKDYIIHKKCECFSSTFKLLNIQKNSNRYELWSIYFEILREVSRRVIYWIPVLEQKNNIMIGWKHDLTVFWYVVRCNTL